MNKMMKRQKPNVLQVLEALKDHVPFNNQLLADYDYYKRGYESELWADRRFEKYGWLIIKSLTFHLEGQYPCQLDTIIITRDKILLYEIKGYSKPSTDRGTKIQYFSGYKKNPNGPMFEHPREQLNDATTKFKQFMRKLGIKKDVESYVMFTHPNFILYGMKDWSFDLVFHSQIEAHIEEMAQTTSSPDAESQRIFDLLMAQNLDTSETMPVIPNYKTMILNNIVKCPECIEVFINHLPEGNHKMNCPKCGRRIKINDIAMKSLNDYIVLYGKIPSAQEFYDWCDGQISTLRFYRILSELKKSIRNGK